MAGLQAAVHGMRVLRPPLRRLVGTDDLLGLSVVSAEGSRLGELRDLMLDISSGELAYAVIAIGPEHGVHDRLVAVPWSAVRIRDDGELGIDLPREVVEQEFRVRALGAAHGTHSHGLVLHPSFGIQFSHGKGL